MFVNNQSNRSNVKVYRIPLLEIVDEIEVISVDVNSSPHLVGDYLQKAKDNPTWFQFVDLFPGKMVAFKWEAEQEKSFTK